MRQAFRLGVSVFLGLSVAALAGSAAAEEKAPPPAGTAPVLGMGSHWRILVSQVRPHVSVASAQAAGLAEDEAARRLTVGDRDHPASGREGPFPPANWRDADFDDSAWDTHQGRWGNDTFGTAYPHQVWPETGLVCLRARFAVNDPAKVKSLSLKLLYEGGCVAWINGKEVARGHMPAGEIKFETPSDDYPPDAWFYKEGDKKGKPIHWYGAPKDQWMLRERAFEPAVIKPDVLRKGVNVLAIEVHRPDYLAQHKKEPALSTLVGLFQVHLRAEAETGAIVGDVDRPAGVQVWTPDVCLRTWNQDWADPLGAPPRVLLAGAKNGKLAGQIVVAATSDLNGIKVSAGDLKHAAGKTTIPAAAVQVRCQRPDTRLAGATERRLGVLNSGYDGLLNAIPPAVKVDAAAGSPPAANRPGDKSARNAILAAREAMGLSLPTPAAVLPLWVTVSVPKNAAEGQYTGRITIAADGIKPVEVPVELEVADWTLPDVAERASLLSIYQSPDTLAMYYKVKPWSDEHWRYIEKSLQLIGEAGNVSIHFPLTAECSYGNAESIVYWIGQPDGAYKLDWTRFDRYLDLALKTHPRKRILNMDLYLGEWGLNKVLEDGKSQGLFTVLDPATGKTENRNLPAFGTPEAEEFWRPVISEAVARLKAKGFDKEIMLGWTSDGGPKPELVAMFHKIAPEVTWSLAAHQAQTGANFPYDATDRTKSVPITFAERVYCWMAPGGKPQFQGWRVPQPLLLFRHISRDPKPWDCRNHLEYCLLCNTRGLGRVSLDYWNVGMKPGGANSEASGGCSGTLSNRYPAGQAGQLALGNVVCDLAAAGEDGPLPTMRLELLKEGTQDAEARIFIEKALLAAKEKLPADLVKRCEAALLERAEQIHNRVGWQGRSLGLCRLAAEVAKAGAGP